MSKQRQPNVRRMRVPKPPGKEKPQKRVPTLESMLADIRRVYGMQLETFVVQFVDNHTDQDIEAFLPEDLAQADSWLDGLVSAFTANEDPTTDEMMDGVAAIFMMAFLERLYAVCGIASNDDEDFDGDGEGTDDGEE